MCKAEFEFDFENWVKLELRRGKVNNGNLMKSDEPDVFGIWSAMDIVEGNMNTMLSGWNSFCRQCKILQEQYFLLSHTILPVWW